MRFSRVSPSLSFSLSLAKIAPRPNSENNPPGHPRDRNRLSKIITASISISMRIAGTSLTPCPSRFLGRNRFVSREKMERSNRCHFLNFWEKSYEIVTTRSIFYRRGNTKSNDIVFSSRSGETRRNGRSNGGRRNASLEGWWRAGGVRKDTCIVHELVRT